MAFRHRRLMESFPGMRIRFPVVGVCGLSCRLCPRHVSGSGSRCLGCKTASRMSAGCPFLTCAVKRMGIEFCWECGGEKTCKRWESHRAAGRMRDSFKCYRMLERDIACILEHGVAAFEKGQKERERLLKTMVTGFNEGRSMSYYCVAATVLGVDELRGALDGAKGDSRGLGVKEKSRLLHARLNGIAGRRRLSLRLRK
jgi:hypothetical protein